MVYSAAGSTMIISCVTFLLGCQLMNFVLDHRTLWQEPTPEAFTAAEQHYKALAELPHIVLGTLAFVFAVAVLGHVLKLHKGNQSNTLFDGGSLVLLLISFMLTVSNLWKGIQIIAIGVYGEVNREDTIRVVAASNAIIVAVLFGVMLLQLGQGHAERATLREIAAFEFEEEEEKQRLAASTVPVDERKMETRKSK